MNNKRKDLGLSLLNIQRTYLQSQQPSLNKHLFQNLVHHYNIDNDTLQQLAPTIPIYLKQLKRWTPRKDLIKPKRHSSIRNSPKQSNRNTRAQSVCDTKIFDEIKNEPKITHLEPLPTLIRKQEITHRFKIPKIKEQQRVVLMPKQTTKQQQYDQITLTPW